MTPSLAPLLDPTAFETDSEMDLCIFSAISPVNTKLHQSQQHPQLVVLIHGGQIIVLLPQRSVSVYNSTCLNVNTLETFWPHH